MKTDIVYASKAIRATTPNEGLAIHCSDHRFQNAFREFLSEGLGLTSYSIIAIPGGGNFPSLTEIMPKYAKAGYQSMSFMIKRTGARRIILMGHEDCLFFRENLRFYFPEEHLHEKQFTSLRRAGAALRERFETVTIEIYFADATPDNRIQFLKID